MFSAEKISIFGNKAVIKQNKFGVWQFRMWISSEKKYVEKSLRTKKKTDAVDLAEELYIQLRNKLANGKTLFAPTYAEAMQQYIAYKQREVDVNALTDGRLTTIKAHLSHFVEYIDKNAKVSDVGINTLVQYERKGKETNYVLFRKEKGIALQTIRNEMATINACQRYLFEVVQVASVVRFRLPSLQIKSHHQTRSGDEIRRITFTHKEWTSFYTTLRNKYVNRKNNTLTDNEYFERELVRHWCLFGANSAMRSGEQRQLRWTDVIIDKQKDSDGDVLVRVNVREETTKVRKDRTFMCKGGNYLQRWQKLQKTYGTYKSDGLIFSTNSEDEYERYRLHRHWKQVLLLTDIDIERREKLVPYSLRHLAITNMTLSGVSLSDIAFMCGTSVKQIEHTYYHLLEEKMRQVAKARFIRKDGQIIPSSIVGE